MMKILCLAFVIDTHINHYHILMALFISLIVLLILWVILSSDY